MTITLIRHGQTLWNAARRMQGHTDIPLCDIGLAQAEKVAARLASQPCDVIYTSDLVRAAKTADVIKSVIKSHQAACIAEVVTTTALRESSFGIFEGRVYDEAREEMEAYRQRGQPYPEAESYDEFFGRVQDFLKEVTASGHEHIYIVSHGGTITAMICHLLGLPYERRVDYRVGNTALYSFKRDADLFVMTLENDTSHLDVT